MRPVRLAFPLVCFPFLASLGIAGESLQTQIDMFHPDSAKTIAWTAFSERQGTSQEDVWRIGPDELVCLGTPRGYLRTQQDFTNFILRFQWRWPEGKPGKGGVLIRITGPDKIWPKSLEAQINAGEAGDFWGLDGYTLRGPSNRMKTVENEQFGRLTNLKKTAAVEREPGQWNDYEIVAQGGVVTLKINGQVVNQTADCDVVPGKICLTAEGSEIHFRNARITVLKQPSVQPPFDSKGHSGVSPGSSQNGKRG